MNLTSKFVRLAPVAVALTPFVSFADVASDAGKCSTITGTGLTGLFTCAVGLMGYVIAIIFLLAFLLFLWGVAITLLKADDQKTREEGRKFMIYGIIALFVMVTVWGLVQVLTRTFGLDGGTKSNSTSSQQGFNIPFLKA